MEEDGGLIRGGAQVAGIFCGRDADAELVDRQWHGNCGGTREATEMVVVKGDPGLAMDEKTLEERNGKQSGDDA